MAEQDGRIEAFRVIGVSAQVRNDDPAGIGKLWERYSAIDIARQVPSRAADDIYCVYHDYDGDERDPFVMTIGCRVLHEAPVPDGLSEAFVPAQPARIFDASGDQPAALMATWQTIWDSELPRAFVADVEVHNAGDPTQVTIQVGVKP